MGETYTPANTKLTQLEKLLKGLDSAVVAYSGGVDSSFLAAVAHRTLGDRALAVTAVSPTYTQSEIESASRGARHLGLHHLIIETDELSDPCFVANSPERCYYCKHELFHQLRRIADERGFNAVLDGSNLDDLKDHRPGRTAARELGVRSPLCEVDLTKAEIRALSRDLDLPTWDKPALACLASRFPYGTSITPELLARVAEAEDYLHELGIKQLRVRHHDQIARIEVDADDMALLLTEPARTKAVEKLRSLGYVYVTLDLAGYRSGSMNEVLKHD